MKKRYRARRSFDSVRTNNGPQLLTPTKIHTRRDFLASTGRVLGGLALWSAGPLPKQLFAKTSSSSIPVGILHSLTGTMASSGRSLVDAIMMGIDEVNQQGGVLGKPLQPILEDGESDPKTFAQKAEQLIKKNQVQTIFGCWTSASRKAVLPIVEHEKHLLWYPVQYEGQEQSPAIMYGGATPNQQILPALEWGIQTFGPRVYLVGSDYVFPRTANQLIKTRLPEYHGELAGETYRPLGAQQFQKTIQFIQQSKPDFVINTLNGDSNQGFFQNLHKANLSAANLPIISMSVAEDELQHIGLQWTIGHFAAWNYFQSLSTPSNQYFVKAFQQRYGQNRVTGDPIEAAYSQVHLYARAANKAVSTNTAAIRKAAGGLIFSAPQGLIRIDPHNQHTWKVSRIGQIQDNGQFKIVWSSATPIKPQPFYS